MSITFSLPTEFTSEESDRDLFSVPCRKCGGHNRHADLAGTTRVEAVESCEVCLGYGGDADSEAAYWERRHHGDGEFNVSNYNGMWVLGDVLNFGSEAEYCGTISPTTVMMRCATFLNLEGGVVEPSCEQGVRLTPEGVSLGAMVCYGGRSLDQIESYVFRLKRLATLALERGAPVIQWG